MILTLEYGEDQKKNVLKPSNNYRILLSGGILAPTSMPKLGQTTTPFLNAIATLRAQIKALGLGFWTF